MSTMGAHGGRVGMAEKVPLPDARWYGVATLLARFMFREAERDGVVREDELKDLMAAGKILRRIGTPDAIEIRRLLLRVRRVRRRQRIGELWCHVDRRHIRIYRLCELQRAALRRAAHMVEKHWCPDW